MELTRTTLDGSLSYDTDGGDIVSYWWIQQLTGPRVTLSTEYEVLASFEAPNVTETTELIFQLQIADDSGNESLDYVSVFVGPNIAPTANAGPDQTVTEGDLVSLDGQLSSDIDGSIAAYSWTQLSGSAVSLANMNTVAPSFTAPLVTSSEILTFELTVTDDDGTTDTDTVVVTINDDTTSPVTSISTTSSSSKGNTFFDITLTPNETATTNYRVTTGTVVSGGADTTSWQTYSGVVRVQAPKKSDPVIEFYSQDSAGNTETTQTVVLVIGAPNDPPTAHAGSDQTVTESDVVQLDGQASADNDGTISSYSWQQTSGSAVTLSGGSSSTPTFTAPEVTSATTLTFELTVTDDDGDTGTDTVVITVNDTPSGNQTPQADAGSNQTVTEGDSVSLDGQLSSDSDGTITTYAWIQLSGSAVTLANENTATPSFVAPQVSSSSTLTFELTVTDDLGATDVDTVVITVNDVPPVNNDPSANAGSDQTVNEGDSVSLDGQLSSDSDGSITAYSWVQLSGAGVSLTNANTATPSFTAPSVSSSSTLTFELTVTDDQGATNKDSVNIIVNPASSSNLPPVADAGVDLLVLPDSLTSLDGQASYDSDGSIVSYSWVQISGIQVTLQDEDTPQPSFQSPSIGWSDEYLLFELTVTDDQGAASSDQIEVRVSSSTDDTPPVTTMSYSTDSAKGKVYYNLTFDKNEPATTYYRVLSGKIVWGGEDTTNWQNPPSGDVVRIESSKNADVVVEFYSVDTIGNTEDVQSVTL